MEGVSRNRAAAGVSAATWLATRALIRKRGKEWGEQGTRSEEGEGVKKRGKLSGDFCTNVVGMG